MRRLRFLHGFGSPNYERDSVAELACVARPHVYNWIRRSRDMPEPAVRLACGPIWLKDEIRDWLIRIGYTHLKNP